MCYLVHHAVINRKTKMKRRKRYQEMRLKFQFLVDKGPSSHHVTKSRSKVGSEDTLLMEYMFWLHIHVICMMYPNNPICIFFLDYTYIIYSQKKIYLPEIIMMIGGARWLLRTRQRQMHTCIVLLWPNMITMFTTTGSLFLYHACVMYIRVII